MIFLKALSSAGCNSKPLKIPTKTNSASIQCKGRQGWARAFGIRHRKSFTARPLYTRSLSEEGEYHLTLQIHFPEHLADAYLGYSIENTLLGHLVNTLLREHMPSSTITRCTAFITLYNIAFPISSHPPLKTSIALHCSPPHLFHNPHPSPNNPHPPISCCY